MNDVFYFFFFSLGSVCPYFKGVVSESSCFCKSFKFLPTTSTRLSDQHVSFTEMCSGSVTETWFRIAIEEQVVLPQLFCERFVCTQLHSKMNMPFLTKFRLFWKVE